MLLRLLRLLRPYRNAIDCIGALLRRAASVFNCSDCMLPLLRPSRNAVDCYRRAAFHEKSNTVYVASVGRIKLAVFNLNYGGLSFLLLSFQLQARL